MGPIFKGQGSSWAIFEFFLDSSHLEDGTDKLSQNVGVELALLAAQKPRKAQFSSASGRKLEING